MRLFVLMVILLNVIYLSAENYSLEDCRKMALEHNHKLKIGKHNQDAAASQVKASYAYFLPKVDLTGSYQRVGEKFGLDIPELTDLPVMGELENGETVQIGTVPLSEIQKEAGLNKLEFGDEDNFILSLSLTQPIFTGWKISNQYNINKYLKHIADESLKLSQSEIIYNVDDYYWQSISLNEKVILANEYITMIERHLQDLENFKIEGLITNNELLKAKVMLNKAKLNQLKASDGLHLTKMALCQVMGLPLHSKIETSYSLDQVTGKSNQEQDIDSKTATTQRAEITILERTLDIAKATIAVNKGTYLPNVVLNANYNLMNPSPYNGFKDEFGDDWMVGLTCSMELFNFGRRSNSIAAAESEEKMIKQKLLDTKELVKLEVQQNLFKVNESNRKITMTSSSLLQAEENLKITKDNFKEGIVNSSEVLDAQTLWQHSYSDNIDAKTEYRKSISALKKSLGTVELN